MSRITYYFSCELTSLPHIPKTLRERERAKEGVHGKVEEPLIAYVTLPNLNKSYNIMFLNNLLFIDRKQDTNIE